MIYDDGEMKKTLPATSTSASRRTRTAAQLLMKTRRLSKALYAWARERGATDYAHWFFPMRAGGSGATGGMLGAAKGDAFIDLDWSSDA